MNTPIEFGRKKLGDYEASLKYYTNTKIPICFNQTLSGIVRNRKLYKISFQENKKENKLFLIFNSSKGYTVSAGKRGETLIITSYRLASKIIKFFSIVDKGSYRLHISKNLSINDNCITIQILNVYSLSELRGEILSSGSAEKKEECVHTEKEQSSLKDTLTIELCINTLKDAGYIILAPKTHYVEV